MTHCIKCHRPLKHPTASGMGRVCEKRSAPAPEHERDLFGFDIDKAVHAAMHRIAVHIESRALEAHMALRAAFKQARVRLGVWR